MYALEALLFLRDALLERVLLEERFDPPTTERLVVVLERLSPAVEGVSATGSLISWAFTWTAEESSAVEVETAFRRPPLRV